MNLLPYARRSFIVLVVMFASLELTLYALGIPKDYLPHSVPDQFQRSIGTLYDYTNFRSSIIEFVYDRNPRGYFRAGNAVQHVVNAVGFRGPEIYTVKPPNTVRFFFLGDSITFGEGVYFEDTYPEQFKKMAEETKLYGEKKVEALNMGVGGFNTVQEFQVLTQMVDNGLIPDHVVVGYNMNDANIPLMVKEGDGYRRVDTELEKFKWALQDRPFWASMFRTLGVVREYFVNKAITQKTIEYYHGLYDENNPSWQATKEALKQFGDFQKKTGIPVTFIVFPRLFELQHYPFKAEREKVRQELEINDLNSVYIYPYLHDYEGPELWVHPTDQHPNEIAHKITAAALVDRLSKEPTK